MIFEVANTTWAVMKIKPEKKNSGLYGSWTPDLWDSGAVLYQLSNKPTWLHYPRRGNDSTFQTKKCVYHVRLELGNHRKKYIYITHTHTHAQICMLSFGRRHMPIAVRGRLSISISPMHLPYCSSRLWRFNVDSISDFYCSLVRRFNFLFISYSGENGN